MHRTAQAALGPSRRALLLGGAAVGGAALLPGCTRDDGPPEPPPPPHPDLVLADEAAARERQLIEAYDLALERRPDLAALLAPLRAEHSEHVAALGVPELETPGPTGAGTPPEATDPATPDDTSSPTPTTAPTTPPPPLLPADPAAVPAALAELERQAAAAHSEAVVRAGRGLAVVLASAAASESSHTVALL